ncbi:other 1 protein kinase [Moniliophthora roreri MCA 2997]|uniref:Other 1 protein kinase n=1 Tax=Moniliophthora roreri (strain MCA 2997) TaxID=1381753 RepID=V2XNG3_MONRO|nr:other 1 protein kinase [Moniliophthora roreri MCA 2997]
MYREVTGKCILNDFDLATLMDPGTEVPDRKGYERTGTRPFMAMDLLNEEGVMGLVYRRYRHDLESFFWVLVWVGACVQGGQEELSGRYEKMVVGTHDDVYKEKTALLRNLASYTTTEDYAFLKSVIKECAFWWSDFANSQDKAQSRGKLFKEESNAYFINSLVVVIEETSPPVPIEINWLLVEVPGLLWKQYQERHALRSDSQ